MATTATTPACQTVRIHAFRGNRSPGFVVPFLQRLAAEKHGTGPGPTFTECLLYAGHTGLSLGDDSILAFDPKSSLPIWQLLDDLKSGDAFPGLVNDDTAVFQTARQQGLPCISFGVRLPPRRFAELQRGVDAERNSIAQDGWCFQRT